MNEETSTELVENVTTGLSDLSIQDIKKKFDAMVEIKKMAYSCLNKHDLADFHGKPYLVASACEKIARGVGLCWKQISLTKTLDVESGHYFYTAEYAFWFKSNEEEKITEIGTRGTLDQFFGTVGGKQKPASEIDETDIKKAAVTNCKGRGIKSILGLGTPTWEEINTYIKPDKQMNQSNVASVSYNTGSQGGSIGGNKITEKQGGRLYAISKGHNITDDQMKDYLLTNYDIEHDPKDKESFLQINRGKDYDEICKWANSQ